MALSGQIKTTNLTNLQVGTVEQIMDGWLGGNRDVQEFIGRLLFNGDSDGGVVRGFDVSVLSLVSTIGAGTLVYWNATPPTGVSKWGFIHTTADMQVTHAAHHASNARIDLISIEAVAETIEPESVKIKGGATPTLDTMHGTTVTPTLTKGVEDGSLTPPATPAGHFLLAQVYVPATSGTLVVLDKREFATGPRHRGFSGPTAQVYTNSSEAVVFALRARKVTAGGSNYTSELIYDVPADWPKLTRSRGDAGETTGAHYPMMIPGGVTWWRSVPWVAAVGESDVGELEYDRELFAGKLTVQRTGTGVTAIFSHLAIPVDARGLRLVSAKLRYQVVTAINNINTHTVEIIHISAAGTATTIGSVSALSNTAGAVLATTIVVTPTIIEEGDCVVAKHKVTVNAGTATGGVRLHSVDVQLEEGQG